MIQNWLAGLGLNDGNAFVLEKALFILGAVLLSIAGYLIAKNILISVIRRIVTRTKARWDDIVFSETLLRRLAHFVPALIIFFTAPAIFPHTNILSLIIQRAAIIYVVLISILSIDAFLVSINELYETLSVSRSRPIKGYVQLVEIFVYIIGGVLVIATVIGKSAVGILSGIGALTAVLLIVFRDSLLGLVASVQLSANKMVQIGDWVEIPKFHANGDVMEINLQTIKVKNFDNTITSLPSYALISESFKNWSSMFKAGGRKIQRSILIDINSIRFCTPEMVERYRKIALIREYIDAKLSEIEEHNGTPEIEASEHPANGRRLTNIGTFRAYVTAYLKNHPKIRQDVYFLVRQLEPNEYGLPLEIYVYSSDTNWANYEGIQADIFDHLLSIIPEFDLAVYQNPSGRDVRRFIEKLRDSPGA